MINRPCPSPGARFAGTQPAEEAIPANDDGTATPIGVRDESYDGPRIPCNCVSQDQYESDKPNYDQWRNTGIVDEEIYPSAIAERPPGYPIFK